MHAGAIPALATKNAPVAQLEELQPSKLSVDGSSPSGCTKLLKEGFYSIHIFILKG